MKYTRLTKHPPNKVIDLAERHFLERSMGLKLSSKSETSICLDGTEGYISMSACKSGWKTRLEIETLQYDSPVKDFLKSL